MFRTVIFFSSLWLSLMVSMIIIVPLYILEVFKLKSVRNKFVFILIRWWTGFILFLAGVKIRKKIPEKLPGASFVMVSNHQGNFDILVILFSMPVIPAFISKIELKKVPFLSKWMRALDCLFIDRSDSRGSRQKILKRLQEKGHHPLVLFPEGTRSRSRKLLPFRTGGLKMIYDSRTDVLPVSISGTYRIWEQKKRIIPGTVFIEVKPLLRSETYANMKFETFIKTIKELVDPGFSSNGMHDE